MPVVAEVLAPEGVYSGGWQLGAVVPGFQPASWSGETGLPYLRPGCWQLVSPYCLTVTMPQHQGENA